MKRTALTLFVCFSVFTVWGQPSLYQAKGTERPKYFIEFPVLDTMTVSQMVSAWHDAVSWRDSVLAGPEGAYSSLLLNNPGVYMFKEHKAEMFCGWPLERFRELPRQCLVKLSIHDRRMPGAPANEQYLHFADIFDIAMPYNSENLMQMVKAKYESVAYDIDGAQQVIRQPAALPIRLSVSPMRSVFNVVRGEVFGGDVDEFCLWHWDGRTSTDLARTDTALYWADELKETMAYVQRRLNENLCVRAPKKDLAFIVLLTVATDGSLDAVPVSPGNLDKKASPYFNELRQAVQGLPAWTLPLFYTSDRRVMPGHYIRAVRSKHGWTISHTACDGVNQ